MFGAYFLQHRNMESKKFHVLGFPKHADMEDKR